MSGATSVGRGGLIVRRGQVVLAELDPVVGSEQGKVRPSIVVSNNAANGSATKTGRGVITIVPITSNTRVVHAFQVLLESHATGLVRQSKAQAEQVRSIAVSRVVRQLGWIAADEMARIDEALRVHLYL